MTGRCRKEFRISPIGLVNVYIISIPFSASESPQTHQPSTPHQITVHYHSTTHTRHHKPYTLLSFFTMSSTYDYNDSETSESLESPRLLDHDDLESVVGESDNPVANLRKGLAGVHDLPVSLTTWSFSLLAS